ncbi:glycogen/starch/alpha-glucan phosphorylase [Chitinophaga sedimenti]|uniref:glycogen/starch/alpha-glucan phosphorylase n=1 Tax=Chitinophaga sedimenti TaxID=2033606 RepID=UPI0020035DD8|nr:glycogen/starch/alpha-glucan phosphorylase [Chitinophaga sedimenti]MCK7557154.1 glycogen/starch/alpha-glucan phosphorylase [Chitinophaga sedimenti]
MENYDMETAQLLVQGVDLWLNTPRVQEEACGTSGMKVILNGALHCSTLDGWWAEAYQEDAGWAISQDERLGPGNWQEQQDADKLYKLLEQQIIPAFFDRNNLNMPEKWLRMIRKSMTTVLPAFNMKRPAAAYAEQYEHLAKRTADLSNNKYALLNDFVRWKQMMRTSWNELHVFSLHLPDFNNEGCKVGDIFAANLEIYLGALNADDITVEALFTRPGSTEEYFLTGTFMLEPGKGNRRLFSIALPLQHTGASGYTFRVRPKHPQLLRSRDLPLVMWI